MSARPGGYVRPQAPPYRITPGAGRHDGRDLLSEPPDVELVAAGIAGEGSAGLKLRQS